ncbi:hypothetical protein [Burkholderia sp. Ac-20344]|uniref:hypothetical protein n=1 Tax=Burkholderia sp. Ac-20344 TaxID=2703890 RepID=UPI00197B39F7|nr:hypothetical protein [Burkholderia sp. Ac-20344]MBN3833773.1 hypothetical protein [Burkholderia sp. Ac-20344]
MNDCTQHSAKPLYHNGFALLPKKIPCRVPHGTPNVKLTYRYDAGRRLASAENRGEHPHAAHFAYDRNGRLSGQDQHGEL